MFVEYEIKKVNPCKDKTPVSFQQLMSHVLAHSALTLSPKVPLLVQYDWNVSQFLVESGCRGWDSVFSHS